MIIVGAITILYVLFGDIFDGTFDGIEFLNPPVILAFVTLFAAGGYTFEKATDLNSWLIVGIAVAIAIILVTVLNIFVFIPIKNAEQSLGYTDESLIGREAKIITPIPVDGFGQVIIESKTGVITKAAKSSENVNIPVDTKVMVIGVNLGSLIVKASEDK